MRTLTQNLQQMYHQINKTSHHCGPKVARYCTQGEIKCVKNPRAPNSITPDACGHILWTKNTTLVHTIRTPTQNLWQTYHQINKTWHHCGPKVARYCTKSEMKCVKNPRAPNSITPDACGNILWANNTTCAHNTNTHTKRTPNVSTNSQNLTPWWTQNITILRTRWNKMCKKSPGA